MDSKFGALQYIVLPAGATSGRRIILDGVNGTISIYDINGLLLARMGFADSIELFSRQANEVLGADIQAAAIGSAANPARRAELVLESPNLTGGAGGGNRSQLEMLSESFDGTIPTLIQYLSNVHDFLASNGNNPDIRLNSISLPRGIVAVPKTGTGATAIATTTELKDLVVGDYTFTAVAGRRYRVHFQCRLRSTVAADKVDVRIRDGVGSSPTNVSTLLTGAEGTVAATTGGDDLKVEQTLLGLSAGTHIIAAFYIRALGTGNVTLDVATGQNRELYVEDIGGL